MCAWADGEIKPRERAVLSRILATISLADEIHSVVHAWMTEPPIETPDLWENLSADNETAKTALYQVVNMAAADDVFQLNELSMMSRFRGKLNVSLEDFDEIVSAVENLFEKKQIE